jgi:hypothetical protein
MVAAGAAGALLAGLFTNGLAAQRDMGQPDLQRLIVYSVERGLIWAFAGAFALAAASIAVRGDRAGAIGWGVMGAGAGAAAGALGGAVFMLLTNYADLGDNNVRHGLSMAATGIVLGAAAARCMDGDRLAYQAAGLVGGLLGAVLALVVDMPRPGMSEGSGFLLAEALVVFGVIAAVTLAATPAARAPQRARAQQIAG